MGNNLKKIRIMRGMTQQGAADAMGYSKGGYLKLERGERKLSTEHIGLAARAFNVPESDVTSEEVPVIGYVGAGSEAHFYAGGDSPNEWVTAPAGSTDSTVAVQVRGDSLGPGFNRWIVFYDEIRNPPTVDMLRRLCVVGLADGRVLVKWLHPGTEPGRFHLLSQTEGMVENADITWAAIVKSMSPY